MASKKKLEQFIEKHCANCCYNDKCYGSPKNCIMKGHFVYFGVDEDTMKLLGLKVSGIGDKKFFLDEDDIYEK